MLIYYDERKKALYLTLGGDLTADKAEIMQKQFNSYKRREMQMIVIDLARVRTIDSTGLNKIIQICNSLCKDIGELVIENASYELKKLFRRMKIDGRLTISQTGWPG